MEAGIREWCSYVGTPYREGGNVGCKIDRHILGITVTETVELGDEEFVANLVRWNEERVEFRIDRDDIAKIDGGTSLDVIDTEGGEFSLQ